MVSLNYVFVRNDFVLKRFDAGAIMFVGEDSTGCVVEFQGRGYEPGHLNMFKSDYEKLKECSNIVLRFSTDTDQYRGGYGITTYAIPLSSDAFEENYIEIRVYDKKRSRVHRPSHDARKPRIKISFDGSDKYGACIYFGGASQLHYMTWF